MKLKWINKNVFFLKLIFAILITTLAFRLFIFNSTDFSPVFASVTGIFVEKILPPEVLVPENEDLIPQDIELEKCDLFVGKWIPDSLGPIYTNTSCGQLIDGQQNCMTNGRPDSDFLHWKWKPHDCLLPRFDPRRFLHLMRNKSWAIIGDSLSRNHVQSLLCMLSTVEVPVEVYHDKEYKSKRWHFPLHNLTISNIWSPFLVQAAIFEDLNGVSTANAQLHLDKLDKTWTSLIPSVDFAIISTGQWFLKSSVYYEKSKPVGCHNCHEKYHLKQLGYVYGYNTTLRNVMDFIATDTNRKGVVFFRTTTRDHFQNGEWHSGGTCKQTEPVSEDEVEIKDVHKVLRDIEIGQFERAVREQISQDDRNLRLLDFTAMLMTRPDGHPGPYRQFRPFDKDKNAKVQNDCLHWCLPGPFDYLNDVILETIVNG